LNQIYQEAKQRFDSDPEFAERARQRVVALQAGDTESLQQWQRLVDLSSAYFSDVYARLQVLLQPDDIRGESAYNAALPGVVADLEVAGLLRQSEGAAVVYPEGFTDRDGRPMPMIVRKSDGGYLYATTDLAAARYRLTVLHAQRLIYVTDARQRDHFAMVFAVLKAAGWAPPDVRLEHVAFGSVLGKDRKPFKTRAGGIIR
jgi:arginyl-tRNA synthetase